MGHVFTQQTIVKHFLSRFLCHTMKCREGNTPRYPGAQTRDWKQIPKTGDPGPLHNCRGTKSRWTLPTGPKRSLYRGMWMPTPRAADLGCVTVKVPSIGGLDGMNADNVGSAERRPRCASLGGAPNEVTLMFQK